MPSLQTMCCQLSTAKVGIAIVLKLYVKFCCTRLTAIAAGKSVSRGLAEPPAEETSSSGGYAAPRMPVDSVDMFSGLDLTGFAPSATESAAESAQAAPELTQSSAQPIVQRRYKPYHCLVLSLLPNLPRSACPHA